MKGIFIILLALAPCLVAAEEFYHENIIVGAGPSALQLGYYMTKAGRPYLMIERNEVVGSFFTKYPRHEKLISINKRFTGNSNPDSNMRHDWNSLLSDDPSMLFRQYTSEYFPHHSHMVTYLKDFRKRFNIGPVRYNTRIENIRPEHNDTLGRDTFVMNDQDGNVFRCRTVIIATGLSKAISPSFEGMEHVEGYEDFEVDPTKFEDKAVLILGNGNSATEVAASVVPYARIIHMISRSRMKMAMNTHYKGHIRAINLEFLETYLLKALGGVLEMGVDKLKFVKVNNGTQISMIPGSPEMKKIFAEAEFPARIPYDRVIRCFGFQFNNSIFSEDMPYAADEKKSKYPKIKHNYESAVQPGLFFAGSIVHSLDAPKGSGGFITGVRYTSTALFNVLEQRNYGVPWPSTGQLPLTGLITKTFLRLSESSDMWHMQGILADVILPRNGGTTFEFLESFPVDLLPDFEEATGHKVEPEGIVLSMLHFGLNYTGEVEDTMLENRNVFQPITAYKAALLHPCFYHYKNIPSHADFKARNKLQVMPRADRVHYGTDDVFGNWDAPNRHHLTARRFFENIFNKDMRSFYAEDCLKFALTHQRLPHACQSNKFLNQQGVIHGSFPSS